MNPIPSARFVVQSFCFIGVIAVTGCAQPVETAPPPSARATPPRPVATAPTAPDTEAGVKPRPLAAKRPGAPTDGQAAALPAQGDLAAPPLKLIGLTQQETVSLLGAPTAQWDRPPAKVWRYQGPGCAVDVFFYLDVSRNEFSALRTTVAGPDGAAPPSAQPNGQQCLNRIHDVAQRK
jgi:hypothetical protein